MFWFLQFVSKWNIDFLDSPSWSNIGIPVLASINTHCFCHEKHQFVFPHQAFWVSLTTFKVQVNFFFKFSSHTNFIVHALHVYVKSKNAYYNKIIVILLKHNFEQLNFTWKDIVDSYVCRIKKYIYRVYIKATRLTWTSNLEVSSERVDKSSLTFRAKFAYIYI